MPAPTIDMWFRGLDPSSGAHSESAAHLAGMGSLPLSPLTLLLLTKPGVSHLGGGEESLPPQGHSGQLAKAGSAE